MDLTAAQLLQLTVATIEGLQPKELDAMSIPVTRLQRVLAGRLRGQPAIGWLHWFELAAADLQVHLYEVEPANLPEARQRLASLQAVVAAAELPDAR